MRTTLPLNEIVDQWISETDGFPTTKADYRRKINLWFRWLSSHGKDPREPSRSDVIDFKNDLKDQNKSIFTVNGYVTVVKIFYSWCEDRKYYDNIAVGIRSSIRLAEYYKLPLSSEQCRRLLDSIDTKPLSGKRDKLMITLMLSNGLRACEVNRINICDFDKIDETPILHLQRKGRSDKHEYVVIPQQVVDLLEDYLGARGEWDINDALFINHLRKSGGDRLNRGTISLIVKNRLRAIGIDDPKITAHSLRHTCGSLMIEQGLDPQLVQDMLGHSNPATTRIYTNMARQKRLFDHSPSLLIAEIITKQEKRKKQ